MTNTFPAYIFVLILNYPSLYLKSFLVPIVSFTHTFSSQTHHSSFSQGDETNCMTKLLSGNRKVFTPSHHLQSHSAAIIPPNCVNVNVPSDIVNLIQELFTLQTHLLNVTGFITSGLLPEITYCGTS